MAWKDAELAGIELLLLQGDGWAQVMGTSRLNPGRMRCLHVVAGFPRTLRLRGRFACRWFLRDCCWEQHLEGREGALMEQREKLNRGSVAAEL